MNRLLLLIALACLASGCRKPLPSPDYIEASSRYTNLLALHGDEAFSTEQMDEVTAQLGRVSAKSSDHAAAQALIATIASEKQRVMAASMKAALVQPLPPAIFPPTPAAVPEPEVEAPAAAPPPPDELARGTPFAPLLAKYPGCLLASGPVSLTTPDGGSSENDGYELHDSDHCRTRIPGMKANTALVHDGKIAAVLPSKSLKTFITLEDGGTAPVP